MEIGDEEDIKGCRRFGAYKISRVENSLAGSETVETSDDSYIGHMVHDDDDGDDGARMHDVTLSIFWEIRKRSHKTLAALSYRYIRWLASTLLLESAVIYCISCSENIFRIIIN